ncbi:MAG: M23 family metallopeptidase [Lachnospiraceae bacterium]|nr:M23 family metallopeptidase [Lachnospiraceae bacterium]
MKKYSTRKIHRRLKMYRALLIAGGVALLAFPVAVNTDMVSQRYQILINGKVVGIAESEEQAVEAYENARLTLNSQSEKLTLLNAEVTYEPVKARASHVLSQGELAQVVYNELTDCLIEEKTLAYTVKINDYTVTLGSEAEVLALLEQVQGDYDVNNEFVIELTAENKQEVGAMTTNVVNASKTANNPPILASTDEAGNPIVADASANVGEDGILSVEFQEQVEIIETYASQEQLSDVQTAYAGITKEQENNEIYQVQAGDCLSLIADKYGMTTDQLLAINEGLEIDSNILIGDQIVVMVPKPELSVIMQEQTTYTEDYEAEVQYVDNPNKYVGDNTVVQEPQTGNRTVTAIVTYNNGAETNREIIKEQINTEAVAKIVERGTKALPTYIRPTTYGTLTSGFGPRWGTIHKGIDWGVPVGTACRASRAGTVVSAGWSGGYGYCVVIDHGDGVRTRYAHLSSIQVSNGQYVEQGQVIALTGNTGNSTGPHIHFEIIVNGTAVNPANYL